MSKYMLTTMHKYISEAMSQYIEPTLGKIVGRPVSEYIGKTLRWSNSFSQGKKMRPDHPISSTGSTFKKSVFAKAHVFYFRSERCLSIFNEWVESCSWNVFGCSINGDNIPFIHWTPPCFLGAWVIMIIPKSFIIWITVMIFFDKTILIWMTVKIIWHWGPIVFPHVENGSATPDTHPPHTLLLLIPRLSRWITNSVYLTLFCVSPSTAYIGTVVVFPTLFPLDWLLGPLIAAKLPLFAP